MLLRLKVISCKASNGKDALDALSRYKDIGLVLTDINMPIMNGFELMSTIKQLKLEVPVFAVSGNSDQATMQKCEQAGFNGCISKPFSLDSLIGILEKHKIL